MATRKERVVLSATDNLTPALTRAAAAAALLGHELETIDTNSRGANRGMVNIGRNAERSGRHVETMSTHVRSLNTNLAAVNGRMTTFGRNSSTAGRSTQQLGNQFDRASGRAGLLAEAIVTLGPGLVPIGAVAVPAVTGLASALGFAATAGAATVVAFQGFGTAMKAVEAARLEPTVKNLEAAQAALAKLSPNAREAVDLLGGLRDEWQSLRDVASQNFFEGFNEGLRDLPSLMDRVSGVMAEAAGASGDLFAAGIDGLDSDRWQGFYDFLEANVRPALTDLGSALGNTAHALAELWMATAPMNDDFMSWLVEATDDLDQWAAGLDQTQGFQDFVAYIRESGPQVADTLAAVGQAFLDIIEAAAPIGGPVLQGLEGLAKVLSSLADSDIGTPLFGLAAAFLALNRAVKIGRGLGPGVAAVGTGMAAIRTQATGAIAGVRGLSAQVGTLARNYATAGAASTRMQAQNQAILSQWRGQAATVGKAGAAVASLALLTSGAADSIGLTNSISLGLIGTMGGPWGVAIGAASGFALDLAHANDEVADSLERASKATSNEGLDSLLAKRQAVVDQVQRIRDGDIGMMEAVSLFFSGDLDGVEDTLKGLDAQIAKAKENLKGGGPTMFGDPLLDSIRAADQSTQEFIASLQTASELLTRRSDFRGYQAAIDEASAALKDNGKTLDANTEKGRDNGEALDNIAAKAHAYASRLEAIPRAKFLETAREDFIAAAQGFGMTAEAAANAADNLRLFRFTADDLQERVDGLTGRLRKLGLTKAQPRMAIKDAASAQLRRIQTAVNKYGLTRAQATTLVKDLASGKIKTAQQVANRFGITKAQATALLKDLASQKTKAVQGLVNKFGLTKAQATALLNDLASGNLRGIIGLLNSVDGRRVYSYTTHVVTTEYRTTGNEGLSGANVHKSAAGNIFTFAGGGHSFTFGGPLDKANAHPPHIAAAGALRGFAEPETGGEAYIPLANDWRRPRAEAIWEQTGRMMGIQFQRYAEGAVISRAASVPAASAGSQRVVVEGRVSGTMHTPSGPVPIEGVIREVARQEIRAEQDFRRRLDDRD